MFNDADCFTVDRVQSPLHAWPAWLPVGALSTPLSLFSILISAPPSIILTFMEIKRHLMSRGKQDSGIEIKSKAHDNDLCLPDSTCRPLCFEIFHINLKIYSSHKLYDHYVACLSPFPFPFPVFGRTSCPAHPPSRLRASVLLHTPPFLVLRRPH